MQICAVRCAMADGDSAHVQRNLQAILKWSLQQQDEAGSATTAANSSGSDKTVGFHTSLQQFRTIYNHA